MTKEEYDQLPDTFKKIIYIDSQISEIMKHKVVSLDKFGELSHNRKLCTYDAKHIASG